jgi:hypothetical protein
MRVSLSMPCKLQAPEFEMSAMVTDMSLGGIGARLVFDLPGVDASGIRRVEIEGLGAFDVIFRWRSTVRIGVSFKNPGHARKRISEFFEANGYLSSH